MSHALESIQLELDEIAKRGLRRERRILDSPQSIRVVAEGKEYVAFTSNDYLGLAANEQLISSLIAGARGYGVGSGASHMVVGHMRPHEQLELALAEFTAAERALLFSTGYMANVGTISALVGSDDAIFSDELNHASIIDGARLSRAKTCVYKHNDLLSLEALLSESKARRKLIVSDAVFSMDGDIAHVRKLLELADTYDALFLLDDAHGFGVMGPQGRGSLAHAHVSSSRIIYLGTLSKAAGVFGAFISGAACLVDLVLQKARSYIFTTGLPPSLASAALQSLQMIASGDDLRERLRLRVLQFRDNIDAARHHLLPSQTHIQGLVLGSNQAAVSASRQLLERGFLVSAIRPPTVPAGTARLRITFCAAHTEQNVKRLCDELGHIKSE
jgi:8-amino-7-oxononanoate synthase